MLSFHLNSATGFFYLTSNFASAPLSLGPWLGCRDFSYRLLISRAISSPKNKRTATATLVRAEEGICEECAGVVL